MSKKAKTAKARRRTSAPAFTLTGLERMLLVLYNTVPVAVRADVGRRLFHAWTHPDPDVANENAIRWQLAKARFPFGTLSVNVFDDVQAGEPLEKGEA